MKLAVVLVAIGVSAAAATLPMRSSAVEGQVRSVYAVEVLPAPTVAGMGVR